MVDLMDHFVNLLTDAIYSREFQESFVDYTAKSRQKMRILKALKEEAN